ncbi:hypothetical protein M9H77_28107 [Catharanthus roseus]|uniref:Uncharacterized protein n=1 Tax=Catharanthus roseus TaxID=4058 RepID=A0ACC0AFB9_CATRO|nr:hypothetical protein M9H77_28107 [Catharanthus roseus]
MRHFFHICKLKCFPFFCFYRHLIHRINQFFVELFYFVFISFIGFFILQSLNSKIDFRPRKLDLFFTSVSSTTVSSMSTVEMEVFSNSQLIIITILMFIGGEVFTSMIGLHIRSFKLRKSYSKSHSKVGPSTTSLDHIELGMITIPNFSTIQNDQNLKVNSMKYLGFIILCYLLLIHFLGISFVLLYINFVSSAKNVLRNKGLKQLTFAIFTIVSTFASCGFIPTNENMIIFRKNSLLLLILIPQVLFGNTLFPSCLRFSIWFLGKFFKKIESTYLLKNTKEIGYFHLLPSQHSLFLAITVFGFIAIQSILFCILEWNSEALIGMNPLEKIVGVFFQTTNTRHSGEGIVDLSSISPAILVLFVVMMYLPPYTSFIPIKPELEKNPEEFEKKKKRRIVENLIFSQLTYLVMFIILICITERKKLKDDPLNFNVLNITVEVISAYGNVGFSTGYSCARQLKADPTCVDKWYGFVGKWSDEGKVILIVVMFFGRLKKFNIQGGKAWKLL